MKLDKVEVFHIRLPLKTPFRISSGALTNKDTLIIRVWSDGAFGLGESPCEWTPHYSHETTMTGIHVIRDFVLPNIIGVEFRHVEDLTERIAFIRGHYMARAGVEMAIWDLQARIAGKPLCEMFGYKARKINTGVSIGLTQNVDELLETVDGFLAQGYQRLKVKVKPGKDVSSVEAIRKRFGDVKLMLDANSAYTLKDADTFRRLDEYDLMMIEQPLHYEDIYDHSKLQAMIRTPICLDESIKSADDARKAIELKACGNINIKLARVGGLVETKRVHDVCYSARMPVWCGSMLESGIGEAHNIAMACMPNFSIPGDIAPCMRYFDGDIIAPLITMAKDGTITPPSGPGIGVDIDQQMLQKYLVSKFEA